MTRLDAIDHGVKARTLLGHVLIGPVFTPDQGFSVVIVDQRKDVRDFLVSRRARVGPEQAGLPSFGGRRRVPGLRREEVAMLAGLSGDYYGRQERGNLAGAWQSVLRRWPVPCGSTTRNGSPCSIWRAASRPRPRVDLAAPGQRPRRAQR